MLWHAIHIFKEATIGVPRKKGSLLRGRFFGGFVVLPCYHVYFLVKPQIFKKLAKMCPLITWETGALRFDEEKVTCPRPMSPC
jgi:hypothetical protein